MMPNFCLWWCYHRKDNCPAHYKMTIKMIEKCPGFTPQGHFKLYRAIELIDEYRLMVQKDA